VVGFLDRMSLTDIRTLLDKETDSKDLELYIREYGVPINLLFSLLFSSAYSDCFIFFCFTL